MKSGTCCGILINIITARACQRLRRVDRLVDCHWSAHLAPTLDPGETPEDDSRLDQDSGGIPDGDRMPGTGSGHREVDNGDHGAGVLDNEERSEKQEN